MDAVEQILEEAGRFTGEVLAPLNSVGDKEGCVWSPDTSGHDARRLQGRLRQAGRGRLAGAWAPSRPMAARACRIVVEPGVLEMSSSANMAFSMYPGLTHGAYSAILDRRRRQEQKNLYLPKLASVNGAAP